MLSRVFEESAEKLGTRVSDRFSRSRTVSKQATASTEVLKGRRSLSRRQIIDAIPASFSIIVSSSSGQAPMIRLIKVIGEV